MVSPIGGFVWGEREFTVKDGGIGEVTKQLYDTLTGIQYGRLEDKHGWVKKVDDK